MCAHSRAHAKGIYIFMIEINNLVKKFGKKYALDGVSFSIKKGEIVGFLGPNGAGKSTTMNIITGYISPTSGSVTVGGVDVFSEPMKVKKMIGFLPEQPPLYIDMTVWEYLCFAVPLLLSVLRLKILQGIQKPVHFTTFPAERMQASGRNFPAVSKFLKPAPGQCGSVAVLRGSII